MCCSVLQECELRVAERDMQSFNLVRDVLQGVRGVAGHGGVLQCVAVCCNVLQCGAVCCSVLQCVAVCCSVVQCVARVKTRVAKMSVQIVNLVRDTLQFVAVCCRVL